MKNYQFIFWNEWQGFHFITFRGQFADVYKWSILFGYWEIRRWR